MKSESKDQTNQNNGFPDNTDHRTSKVSAEMEPSI